MVNILKELESNFIDFTVDTNSARAFADARDGLKPGQRACLWEMFHSGYTSGKPHRKCAKIAGAVTGNWWPHGDTAIYETFARMSQPWLNNVPEVDWHGNNGSVYTGPECASSRYTEARLSPIVEDFMFKGIKKNSVNMIPNYLEDAQWPEVLPAVLPRLMINGCQGIGSTIANVWLPHSTTEVVNVIINYLKSGNLDYSNLYPSFPSGGIIINKNDIHNIYETGKGKVVLRGRTVIEGNKIIITELPYQVYVQPYVEKLIDMAVKDEVTGISAVYNRSGKKNLKIEIECDESPGIVLTQLYAKTDLQKTYNANQWALVGKTPMLLTLKDYCDIYIKHNLLCIKREAEFDLNKAKARLEIVKGLIKALEDIDNIIALIKQSENATKAKEALISTYSFSENQAKAILDMKLAKLAHLEKVELEQEAAELHASISQLKALISSEKRLSEKLQESLQSLLKKYGDIRKTELTNISKADQEVESIPQEEIVIALYDNGVITKTKKTDFKVQKRKGKGVKQKNVAIDTVFTNTIDTLAMFTSDGKIYKVLADSVPTNGNIYELISLSTDEKILNVTSIERVNDFDYMLFVTKNGMVKKTAISEYEKIRKNGTIAINLKEGDALIKALPLKEEDLLIVTKNGLGTRIKTTDIRTTGRATTGVIGIKLAEGDSVADACLVTIEEQELAIFSKNGMGKKVPLDKLPSLGRGCKGTIWYPSEKGGEVIGIGMIDDNSSVYLIGMPNSICISSLEIPSVGRTGVGNAMIKDSTLKGSLIWKN